MVDTRFSMSIHIMTELAFQPDMMSSSDVLAKSLKTNATFIRKLVSRLVEAKLIESYRGKGGGIKISRRPDEISLKDIYLASMDEKCLVSTHNKPVIKSCPVSCSMTDILDHVVAGIETTTKSYLSKIYLSDLMKKVQKK